MGDWEPCFFWPCWKAAFVAAQSTWEGPQGIAPPANPTKGGLGGNSPLGVLWGTEICPGRGTGALQSLYRDGSKKEVEREKIKAEGEK